MSLVSTFFTALFYLSLVIFLVGMARKIYQYWVTPAPLKIPTAPTPLTQTGVVMRLAREVVLFESLFKSNKWTWLFGWLFHVGLLLVLIRHARYFWPGDLPEIFLLIQPFKYAAFAMVIGLFGLLGRRFFVERIRYISAPSDYLMLLLLLVIGVSGVVMTFTSNHTDVIMVKGFASGLLSFDWANLPTEVHFLVHIFLAFSLLAIFPISKLLHVPGIFFSPTRNQVDDSRKKRHISPWALKQEQEQEVRLNETLGKDE
ncbi:Sulfite reduction-associated complex DsrMKJOP protein DsrM (= HmeC) [Bathymodiolus thermophilus thioautotrophic gill symbiont]|uniref:Sulfite reduction-associated complex DsrMKJOP multiheme protein DsrM n=1 Tax=Bathymodiolus thermophilus thioautotrophic gill symbiont TaxID=2360 RepID=A0A3G3INM4_9GAMM|nr:respiratory nitrate reductase subunit gamma [Bathymodiolus thermophilus thioautotrophic gill symbiont]AYQ57417.1 Sulfite reduction-associated complex DsrMKJOP multiheme protein DsrM [Bathymodiolus thermophilus thioautotrophic gill symbiont]CAB5495259.1 Sulfite reduction-associated complex DsrMKJOP protein DsrM (= HmeC) [Bathymodiolus thermophilus thioautotrophic gill symbiont]CAB5504109.1 Sulfite reduction-associated complex DsrMKJOP protein DsrM (= HmeC) [Bathymodiolus thermophilus thioautot